jgi:hypothetical protein
MHAIVSTNARKKAIEHKEYDKGFSPLSIFSSASDCFIASLVYNRGKDQPADIWVDRQALQSILNFGPKAFGFSRHGEHGD